MTTPELLNLLKHVKFFEISIESQNLFSFMAGVFFASNTWFRVKAMNWVVIYLLCLSAYFYLINKY
jgi:hypothetical protein